MTEIITSEKDDNDGQHLSMLSLNHDYYCKGREGGGQRLMTEIITNENDDNDGRPLGLSLVVYNITLKIKPQQMYAIK